MINVFNCETSQNQELLYFPTRRSSDLEEDVRTMGRSAMGVKAISLDEGDQVVAMDLVEEDKYLLVISEQGFGKKTPLADRKSTRLNSSHVAISYAVFCLKKITRIHI